jgi:hypothetical protein
MGRPQGPRCGPAALAEEISSMKHVKALASSALLASLTTLSLLGCDSSSGVPSPHGSGGAGGRSNTGGTTGNGGGWATGGSPGSGGSSSMGGSAGGASGSGGSSASGGNSGAGGAAAAGGAAGAGGAAAAGGTSTMGSGGATTGGNPGSGGLVGSGGRLGSGGRSGGGGNSGTIADAGAGGTTGVDAGPEAPGGTIGAYGSVYFVSNTRTQIVRLQTTMVVPPEPPASGTLFLWPGLEPLSGSAHFSPIGTGVLQPVLTWGSSCAPGVQPRAYSTWWISAQYVNTLGNAAGYMGCYGGPVLAVNVGDELNIDMQLVGTTWNQTVTDVQTSKSVSFSEDLGGQAQNWAMFVIEEYSSAPVSAVTFTDTVITYGAADAADCKLDARGPTDFVSVPVASTDGLKCSIAQIILRAKGIQ